MHGECIKTIGNAQILYFSAEWAPWTSDPVRAGPEDSHKDDQITCPMKTERIETAQNRRLQRDVTEAFQHLKGPTGKHEWNSLPGSIVIGQAVMALN